jgi:hypothetical protein
MEDEVSDPLEFDDDEDWDEEECPRCKGDGNDPWNDYLLPCPMCNGDGH